MYELNFDEIKKRKEKYDRQGYFLTVLLSTVMISIIELFLFKATDNYIIISIVSLFIFTILLIVNAFIVINLLKLKHSKITKELNIIINNFNETQDTRELYYSLVNIKDKVKDAHNERFWIFNYTTALSRLGKLNEALIYIKNLDEIVPKNEITLKKYIEIQIKDIENMKKSA